MALSRAPTLMGGVSPDRPAPESSTAHGQGGTPVALGAGAGGETLDVFLWRAATRYGPLPALRHRTRYRTETWTYADLLHRADGVASLLRARGVGRGDRVVLWAPNGPWWVAAFFACARLGAVVVPLDVRSDGSFVRLVASRTEPRLALVAGATAMGWNDPAPAVLLEEVARGVGPGVTSGDRVGRSSGNAQPVGAASGVARCGVHAFQATATTPHTADAPEPFDGPAPGDLAEIIFTSGTTGEPKGVMLTHANILSNVAAVDAVLPPTDGLRLLSILPLSHMFEQTVGLLVPLRRGACVAYPRGRGSREILWGLREGRITALLAVPQALQLFYDAVEREAAGVGGARSVAWRSLLRLAERVPLPVRRLLFAHVHRRLGGALEFVVSGGAPLAPELQHRWERLGVPVLQGYGATEAAPVVTATTLADRAPRTVGAPLPGIALRIAPDGEVQVRGANVTPGYWKDPNATREAFDAGWYRTGDLGRLDARGRLSLLGRTRELIVLQSGMNVYPRDVESALRRSAGVRDAVALGMSGAAGATVHAVLLLEPGADPAGVVGEANGRLASHQQIRDCTVWPEAEFPRTHTLKLRRGEIEETTRRLREGREPGAPAPAWATPVAPLPGLVARVAGVSADRVGERATLGELGIDSLGRVELAAALEEELGASIDEDALAPATTVAELAELARRGAGAAPAFPAWPLSPAACTLRGAVQPPLLALAGLVAPLEVRGQEHLVELDEPVLWAANHASHLDTPTLLRALPRARRARTAVAAAADYFYGRTVGRTGSDATAPGGEAGDAGVGAERGAVPRVRPYGVGVGATSTAPGAAPHERRGRAALGRALLGFGVSLALNGFPFARTGAIRRTLEHCGALADGGWSILVYPEGTRSTDGRVAPFKPGLGLLAVELGMTVVPVRLEGTERVLPKGRRLPRRGRVRVTFGAPLRFPPGAPPEEAATAVERAIRAMRNER